MGLTFLHGKTKTLKKDLNAFVSSYIFPDYPEKIAGNQKRKNHHYLDEHLKGIIDEIDTSLNFLIEYPYTDRLYRDTYYNYLSSVNKTYGRDCIRISLFSSSIKSSEVYFSTQEEITKHTDTFLGYLIIRPSYPVGYTRSYLHPKAFNRLRMISCQSSSTSRINGLSFTLNAFPHAAQDGVYRSCAETTLWLLMEYFGTKYENYGTILPSHIHKINRRISFQRSIPSSGMGYQQIGYVLRKLGFGSISYTKSKYGQEFNYIINDYIESGIPIIALSEHKDRHEKHAILIIGHTERDDGTYPIAIKNKELLKEMTIDQQKSPSFNLIDSFDCVTKEYVVMDDNKTPYQLNKLDEAFKYYGEGHFMSTSTISAIIVPLYPKIYLDIYGARIIFNSVITNPTFGYKHSEEKNLISRILLTPSKSYRRYLRNQDSNEDVYRYISTLSMPKFIFLVEISTPELYPNGKGIGFMIIDSTSSINDSLHNSLITIAYPDRIYVNTDGYLDPYNIELEIIKLYVNNLDNF